MDSHIPLIHSCIGHDGVGVYVCAKGDSLGGPWAIDGVNKMFMGSGVLLALL
jgi:hypothetical protein